MSPTGKSYSFRSCVRASEAACGRETTLLPWLCFGTSNSAPGPARPGPARGVWTCWGACLRVGAQFVFVVFVI